MNKTFSIKDCPICLGRGTIPPPPGSEYLGSRRFDLPCSHTVQMIETKTQEQGKWTHRHEMARSVIRNPKGEVVCILSWEDGDKQARFMVEALNSHATLTRERDSLREALEKVTKNSPHPSWCEIGPDSECNCGLQDARQILSATEGRPHEPNAPANQ